MKAKGFFLLDLLQFHTAPLCKTWVSFLFLLLFLTAVEVNFLLQRSRNTIGGCNDSHWAESQSLCSFPKIGLNASLCSSWRKTSPCRLDCANFYSSNAMCPNGHINKRTPCSFPVAFASVSHLQFIKGSSKLCLTLYWNRVSVIILRWLSKTLEYFFYIWFLKTHCFNLPSFPKTILL